MATGASIEADNSKLQCCWRGCKKEASLQIKSKVAIPEGFVPPSALGSILRTDAEVHDGSYHCCRSSNHTAAKLKVILWNSNRDSKVR
jgi:hypothetical protein